MRGEARVTAYDRGNHNSCSYVYEVHGTSYSNTDSCANYSGGPTVAIVYDKHDPSISITGDPTEEFDSQLITWFLAMAGSRSSSRPGSDATTDGCSRISPSDSLGTKSRSRDGDRPARIMRKSSSGDPAHTAEHS